MTSELEQLPLQPGMVVLAKVLRPFEDPHCRGKIRPAVLVERVDGHWRTMGLTTKKTYVDGSPRVPVPTPYAVGLSGPSWLWGRHLTSVSVLDLHRPLGWADEVLVNAIADLAHLPAWQRRQLLAIAAAHYPSTPAAAA